MVCGGGKRLENETISKDTGLELQKTRLVPSAARQQCKCPLGAWASKGTVPLH